MNVSKRQLDRYIEAKCDLAMLEHDHADIEERLATARTLIAAFEESGIVYNLVENVIAFNTSDKPRDRHVGATVNADDLF